MILNGLRKHLQASFDLQYDKETKTALFSAATLSMITITVYHTELTYFC